MTILLHGVRRQVATASKLATDIKVTDSSFAGTDFEVAFLVARIDGFVRVADGLPRACPARGIIGHSCSYATASAIERNGLKGAHQRRRDPDGGQPGPCLGQSLYG